MPVHPVTHAGRVVGYQWGHTGKVYKSKAAAQKQAAAIYASGWRGDAARARAKRQAHKHLTASRGAEAQYVQALTTALRAVHKATTKLALEHHVARSQRQDAPPTGEGPFGMRFVNRMFKFVRKATAPAFDRMAKTVANSNAAGLSQVGIQPKAAGLSDIIDKARDDNLALIENAARDYADDVRELLEDPDAFGARVEDLADELMERASVSASRAALIARDQTLKLNAAISQARQEAAGVERYTWSTSHDERVRPSHADLDGETFDWDDPPETNDDGDTNHPGEDYQCRCVAIPVIDFGEEEEPEAAASEGEPEEFEEPGEAAAE